MSDRYYLSTTPTVGEAKLEGAEAHHLLHVMRGQVGDEVTLFDGTGGQYRATILTCGRSEVLLATTPRQEHCRELATRIRIGVALPKGDRQKWLVEKLTELGVAQLTPLSTQRSVAELRGKSLERLERGVIEACKQCGRNTLMQIDPPENAAQFIQQASGRRWIAHPAGEPLAKIQDAWGQDPLACEVSLLVGPEGGFTDMEVQQAIDAGWQSVSLGASILRIETAAVALAAIVAYRSG